MPVACRVRAGWARWGPPYAQRSFTLNLVVLKLATKHKKRSFQLSTEELRAAAENRGPAQAPSPKNETPGFSPPGRARLGAARHRGAAAPLRSGGRRALNLKMAPSLAVSQNAPTGSFFLCAEFLDFLQNLRILRF
jgi:hypothetical protein